MCTSFYKHISMQHIMSFPSPSHAHTHTYFCQDGSDRLMKRASCSCCNFLCVALAATYLKYRRCRLHVVLAVRLSLFFHCDTYAWLRLGSGGDHLPRPAT